MLYSVPSRKTETLSRQNFHGLVYLGLVEYGMEDGFG